MHTLQRIRRLRGQIREQHQRRQLHAATAPHRFSGIAAAGILAAGAGADTTSLRTWLSDNAVPLGVLISGVIIVMNARKKDHASTVNIVGGTLIGLAVVGVAIGGFAPGMGAWLVGLIWHGSSDSAAGN
jgi:hypothetical protein